MMQFWDANLVDNQAQIVGMDFHLLIYIIRRGILVLFKEHWKWCWLSNLINQLEKLNEYFLHFLFWSENRFIVSVYVVDKN